MKNWLLSFPLAFFPHPSIQEGDVRQRWGGWVGVAGGVRCGVHLGDTQAAPCTLKAHHHTKGGTAQVKQEKRGLPSAGYPSKPGSLSAEYELTRPPARSLARWDRMQPGGPSAALISIRLRCVKSGEIERRPMMPLASGRTSWKHDVELCSCRRSGGGIDI